MEGEIRGIGADLNPGDRCAPPPGCREGARSSRGGLCVMVRCRVSAIAVHLSRDRRVSEHGWGALRSPRCAERWSVTWGEATCGRAASRTRPYPHGRRCPTDTSTDVLWFTGSGIQADCRWGTRLKPRTQRRPPPQSPPPGGSPLPHWNARHSDSLQAGSCGSSRACRRLLHRCERKAVEATTPPSGRDAWPEVRVPHLHEAPGEITQAPAPRARRAPCLGPGCSGPSVCRARASRRKQLGTDPVSQLIGLRGHQLLALGKSLTTSSSSTPKYRGLVQHPALPRMGPPPQGRRPRPSSSSPFSARPGTERQGEQWPALTAGPPSDGPPEWPPADRGRSRCRGSNCPRSGCRGLVARCENMRQPRRAAAPRMI